MLVLKQDLAAEKAARLKAVEMALAAQSKSEEEIRKLRNNLEKAKSATEKLRKRPPYCVYL